MDLAEARMNSVVPAHGELGAGGLVGGNLLTAQAQDAVLVEQHLV